MITPERAFARLKTLPMFARMQLRDFRSLVLGQRFTLASAATSSPSPQSFPGGGIILGIEADANVVGAANNGFDYRKGFAVSFDYSGGESLTPGGPILASALFGPGESLFPRKEILVAPTQTINATVRNLTSDTIEVHLAYHALVWRFAA